MTDHKVLIAISEAAEPITATKIAKPRRPSQTVPA
jgi:hypothetical protein